MNDDIAVVGWAQSHHAEALVDETHQSLIYDVVRRALDSCNLTIQDIDVVIDAGSDFLDGRGISTCMTIDAMGAHFKEESKVASDGLLAAVYAYMRLASGLFDTALVVGYSKSSESDPGAQSRSMCEPFYLRGLGLDAVAAAALQKSSYVQHFKADDETFAQVVVKNRRAALDNPHAQLREEVTEEQVADSPVLVSPLKALEYAPVTDGACAVVLAEGSVGRSLGVRGAWITGVGHCSDAYYPGARQLHRALSAESAFASAFRMAGIVDPLKELDVAEVSALTACQELMLCEAMGLCDRGEAARMLKEGRTDVGGDLVVNRSGGALCANPLIATGLVRLAEAASQVTGRAGPLQVGGARKSVAHAGGGFAMQSSCVVVVER